MNIDIFAERVRKISTDKISESSWDLKPDLLITVYCHMSNSHKFMGVNGEALQVKSIITIVTSYTEKYHAFVATHNNTCCMIP